MKNKNITFWWSNFISDPKSTASIIPSSRFLSNKISSTIKNPEKEIILELGPGMGHITKGMYAVGVKPENIITIDINPDMIEYMKVNHPGVKSYVYDATKMHELLFSLGIDKVDRIISSLGLLRFDEKMIDDLFLSASKSLVDGGEFIQYTYGGKNPAPQAKKFGFTCKKVGFVPLNIPPATVYKYKLKAPLGH